jgi:streptogramin lyase
MRAGVFKRKFLLLLSVSAIVAVAAAPADAAEPTLYQLPDATHAFSVAAGADGTVWFSPGHGSEWQGPEEPGIGRLSADGTVDELPVPGFGRPVLGPAGEVWVSGVSKDAAGEDLLLIGLLSPSGQIEREYAVGRGQGTIRALAPTRDAVWLVHFRPGRDSIERVSVADGSVRQFAIGPECHSNGLAVAPGSALWFTEACRRRTHGESGPGGSSIVRIAPSGKIVRYRLKRKDYPISIAVGPNGTAWFGVFHSGISAARVGRITRAGSLAEYRVPNGYPSRIAVGRDGRLWFPSTFGGGVYRALNSISASGQLGEPVFADPSCELAPSSLTASPDGGLWYALATPHTIGGGGGTQIWEGMTIENEAGFIGHLVP